jgi:hypothetical protein
MSTTEWMGYKQDADQIGFAAGDATADTAAGAVPTLVCKARNGSYVPSVFGEQCIVGSNMGDPMFKQCKKPADQTNLAIGPFRFTFLAPQLTVDMLANKLTPACLEGICAQKMDPQNPMAGLC